MIRRLALIALPLFLGACSPFLVSRDLRGGGDGSLYIYPPGSRPQRVIRVIDQLATACESAPSASGFFALHYRSRWPGPAVLIRDVGKVPPTKEIFDADVTQLLSAASCLSAEQKAALREQLWDRMPRRFSDDLLGRYGFDPRRRRVDLQAGMRLRIEWEAFAADVLGDEENSYIGTGATWWYIGSRPKDPPGLTFEPAFGWGDAGPLKAHRSEVIAGVIDLTAQGRQRRYYRLLYPRRRGFTNARERSDNLLNRASIVGGDTLAAIDDVTQKYDDDDECSMDGHTGGGFCIPITGRSVPVPEIEVRLDGGRTWLSIGTTLRQLVEREGRTHLGFNHSLVFGRVYGRDVRRIAVDEREREAPDLLDLPLIKGDHIRW